MPPQLPFLTIHADDIPDWQTEYEPINGVHIIIDNKTHKPVLAIHADATASLVMAVPKLLKFLSLFGLNHPCRIPVDNILNSINIKLIRKGEEDVKQKSETLAE